jgi:drug/metabolite transporter (DMT)-like permease
MLETTETFLRGRRHHPSITQDGRRGVVTYSVQREQIDRDIFDILSKRCDRVECCTMTGRVPEAGGEFLFCPASPAVPSMAGIPEDEHAFPLHLKITERSCSIRLCAVQNKAKSSVRVKLLDRGTAGPSGDQTLLPPVLASASASIITGTALVATRYVVIQADGLTIATLRYLIATVCLLPLVALFHKFDVARRDLIPILGPWCISAAMLYTTASEGAIVLACTPAVTLLLAGLTRSEVFSIPKAFGVAFAFVGALVAFGRSGFNLNGQVWLGNLLMVLATVLGAVYAVFSKPYLAKYPPLTVTAIAMGAGAVALVSAWALEDLTMRLPHFTPGGWLAIGYVGAAGGALSFFLYAWALGRATPTSTMVLIPLNPIAAFVAGALCLGEPVGKELFAGLILVIVGIALVVRKPNPTTTLSALEIRSP